MSKLINWLVTTFEPAEKYDCWHHRAAFHIVTDKQEISGI